MVCSSSSTALPRHYFFFCCGEIRLVHLHLSKGGEPRVHWRGLRVFSRGVFEHSISGWTRNVYSENIPSVKQEMAVSGDDFHVKGVPAHATVVKPCKTASQVSLVCYPHHNARPQGDSPVRPVRPTILKGHRCVFFEFHVRKLMRTCFPYLLKK